MAALPPESIQARLVMDHDDLDAFLDRLIEAFETGDREAAALAYKQAEALLNAHFKVEEEFLFPDFAAVEPRETEELQAEHRALRARLEELAVGVELHQTTLGAVRELAQMLRRHAARENTLLYRWADRVYSDPTRQRALENFFTHGRSPAAQVL